MVPTICLNTARVVTMVQRSVRLARTILYEALAHPQIDAQREGSQGKSTGSPDQEMMDRCVSSRKSTYLLLAAAPG